MTPRLLIVNADDFGQSVEVNEGIIYTHERGLVTSASLMVRWPAAAAAASWARSQHDFSLGLHFDVGEWVWGGDEWEAVYQVVPPGDAVAVRAEFARQLEAFRRIVGANPTHLDSHQHVHMEEPIRSVVAEARAELGIPLRRCTRAVRYCGDFYGQNEQGSPFPGGISLRAFLRLLDRLRPGITELSCHPGFGNAALTVYRDERAREVEVLCDPRARAALCRRGIELVSFRSVR
jgi:predicted glycoside hydrolase/deacetylase ChbG (UPF0249 family)